MKWTVVGSIDKVGGSVVDETVCKREKGVSAHAELNLDQKWLNFIYFFRSPFILYV